MSKWAQRNKIWIGAMVAVVGTAVLLLSLSGARSGDALATAALRSSTLAERWGIDRIRIMRTGAGHLLDFRYRIVDARKAAALQEKGSRPLLIDNKSGARLTVPRTPKAGALRNAGRARVGRTYFALFANAGGLVRSGDRVSVVINDFRANDLVVE